MLCFMCVIYSMWCVKERQVDMLLFLHYWSWFIHCTKINANFIQLFYYSYVKQTACHSQCSNLHRIQCTTLMNTAQMYNETFARSQCYKNIKNVTWLANPSVSLGYLMIKIKWLKRNEYMKCLFLFILFILFFFGRGGILYVRFFTQEID